MNASNILIKISLLLFSNVVLFAQENDSIPFKKNEVGVNMFPFVISNFWTPGKIINTNVFYKRYINKKTAFRLEFIYKDDSKNLCGYANDFYLWDFKSKKYEVLFGVEKLFALRKKFFLNSGICMNVGYVNSKSESFSMYSYPNQPLSQSKSPINVLHVINNAEYFKLGLSFYAGIIYNLSQRINISSRILFWDESYMKILNYTYVKEGIGKQAPAKASSGHILEFIPLYDISLGIRF